MEKTEIRAIIRRLEKQQENLTPYQAEFVKGIRKYFSRYNKLSDKQIDALLNINSSIMAEK